MNTKYYHEVNYIVRRVVTSDKYGKKKDQKKEIRVNRPFSSLGKTGRTWEEMSGPQPKAEAQLAARANGTRGEEPGMTLEKQQASVSCRHH